MTVRAESEQPAPQRRQESSQAQPAASRRYILIELAIVTMGVLIALTLDGAREWMQNRSLVREARATIAQEITENRKELDEVLSGHAARRQRLNEAITLADDVLAGRPSSIRQLQLSLNLANLSEAGLTSAERTGALGSMRYPEVQRYSRLYAGQELFASQQRRSLERTAGALTFLRGDPGKASAADLTAFRTMVLGMLGDLTVEEQLGAHLRAAYDRVGEE
jgi:hypothetical protein